MKNNCSLLAYQYQSVPEQWPPASFPSSLFLTVMLYGMECPFALLGSTVQALSPPSYLFLSSLLAGRDQEAAKSMI